MMDELDEKEGQVYQQHRSDKKDRSFSSHTE